MVGAPDGYTTGQRLRHSPYPATVDVWRKAMTWRHLQQMALVVGAAMGGAAIQTIHAQAKPAYVIVAIRSVTDAAITR